VFATTRASRSLDAEAIVFERSTRSGEFPSRSRSVAAHALKAERVDRWRGRFGCTVSARAERRHRDATRQERVEAALGPAGEPANEPDFRRVLDGCARHLRDERATPLAGWDRGRKRRARTIAQRQAAMTAASRPRRERARIGCTCARRWMMFRASCAITCARATAHPAHRPRRRAHRRAHFGTVPDSSSAPSPTRSSSCFTSR
jgi:hypothetical protein